MDKTNLTALSAASFQNQIEELQQRATKDALSGLLNRATLEQRATERLRAMAPEDSCALFIVDLDNFKQVNDTLGHQAGDQAIRRAAQILSGLFRASDIVGRLGGDEFVVFLCGRITEELVRKKAAAICETLQLALGDHSVVNLTASVGAHLAGKGQAFEGLYRSADLALYKAKKAGKHRFYLKSGEGGQGELVGGVPRPVNAITLGGLLEHMESGVALLEMGEAPQVIYVSPSFCRILRADPKTYPLPQPLSKLIHPDDLSALLDTLREGLSRGQTVEHSHRVSAVEAGHWVWWHIRAARIAYEAPNPVMLITAMDISQFKEREQRQEEQIRSLQAALDQTSKRLWEVDPRTGVFRAYTRDGKYRSLGAGDTRFPEQLIEGGWVHPSSVARFRGFAKELLSGRAQGFGNFAVRSGETGCYSWAAVSYHMLFDEVGRAVRAVGVLEELPQSFGGLSALPTDQKRLPEGLVTDLIMCMRANLELDTVELLWEEGADLSSQVQETRCSQLLQMELQRVFRRGDQRSLQLYFDREQLLEQFRAGRRWLCAEYRRADSGGGIRWVRHVVYLTEEPISRQIYLFAYLLWLDPDHRLEGAVRGDNLRDAVSRLYSRETIQRIADHLFAGRTGGNRAVAVLQIGGLPHGTGADSREAGRMRYEIAAALSLVMGGGCVLGQYSPTQLVIVFSAVTAKETLRRQVEEGLDCLRRMLAPEAAYRTLRFIVGIALLSAEAAHYSAMLAQALRTCTLQADAADDTVTFAQEIDDWGWTQLTPSQKNDRVSIHSAEMARPLSALEKDVAFDCVAGMLTAKTLDASLLGVLKTIGAYYHADRVYSLLLVEDRRAVIMTFEWTSPSKRSIQQVVSGMPLERFPLLERCLYERAPVFLTRTDPELLKSEGAGEKWYFTAFPLIRAQTVEGFLCIENAREHPEDAALFGTLIPYMLQERERFRMEPDSAGTVRHLMDLPDQQVYLDTLQTLTSEHFTSLGAVCLDIPRLSDASRRSFESGSKLLWYVAKTLTDLFGSSLLFRIWDTEFVAFFPNTTREVFLGRCGRLRSILQRRYPGQIRIGRAWAEDLFTGKRLVQEARAAMRLSKVSVSADVQGFAENVALIPNQAERPEEKRFVVYLQPKIDMCTGLLAGAEALVRGVADDGSIVPPSQFIALLEEDGVIRDLDLMVLERSLAQVDQWQRLGLGTVPVAVNLSRVTISHPSTMASILALQSRYPDVPPTALELEITERGGGMDNAELQKIVAQYHACGLRLSLDDFGSQYANLPLFTSVKFDTVKLDRSLISEVVTNPISRTLVKDIIQICREFHMGCVAEGVETAEQASALLDMGCTCAQGFYYDKPLPMEEFEWKYLRPAEHAAREEQDEEERP